MRYESDNKEGVRLVEMEKEIGKLIKSVKDGNYMLVKVNEEDEDTVRSKIIPVSYFNAFIHKKGQDD